MPSANGGDPLASALVHNPDPIAETRADQGPNVEVWNDLVSPRDLLVSLLLSAACAVGSLVIAGATGSQPLFWGLGGCVLGFAISCVVVRPKREVVLVDDTAEGGAQATAADAATHLDAGEGAR